MFYIIKLHNMAIIVHYFLSHPNSRFFTFYINNILKLQAYYFDEPVGTLLAIY